MKGLEAASREAYRFDHLNVGLSGSAYTENRHAESTEDSCTVSPKLSIGSSENLAVGLVESLSISSLILDFAANLLGQSGYLGIFVLMLMESATLPIPSEIVLPLGGYLVFQGRLEFWTTVVAASLGSLVGTMVDYGIGFYLGRPAVLRYGRIVRIRESHLHTAEGWFASHGRRAVLLARFVPLLRTLIAFPAGTVRMDVKQFLLFSAVGIFVWDAALVYVGVVAGQNSAAIGGVLESYFLPLGLAVLGIVVIVAYLSTRRNGGEEQG